MRLTQLQDYAEEHFDNPEEVLSNILMDLIYDNGWSCETTLEEAVMTHSKALERKLKNYE